MNKTALSVNLNKVALVRNTRHLGIPSVTRAATLCLEAGASGITVHPRPDERHIRAGDVRDLAALLQTWPDREFNVEGNPFHNLMDCVRDLRSRGLPVHQVTFVPDSEGQFTSDHGWNFPADAERLRPLIAQAPSNDTASWAASTIGSVGRDKGWSAANASLRSRAGSSSYTAPSAVAMALAIRSTIGAAGDVVRANVDFSFHSKLGRHSSNPIHTPQPNTKARNSSCQAPTLSKRVAA